MLYLLEVCLFFQNHTQKLPKISAKNDLNCKKSHQL